MSLGLGTSLVITSPHRIITLSDHITSRDSVALINFHNAPLPLVAFMAVCLYLSYLCVCVCVCHLLPIGGNR